MKKCYFFRCAILSFIVITILSGGFIKLSYAQKKKDLTIDLPDMKGWQRSQDILIYNPGNLYEYINGAAEFYLRYGFEELWVVEYNKDQKAEIIIELYRHKDTKHAFGIYSQERPRKGTYIDVGIQGYVNPPILNFVTGDTYVKINGYDLPGSAEDVLKKFAEEVAAKLGGTTSPPAILTVFPDKGKQINSEEFIPSDFLGLEFFHSGYTADYKMDQTLFQLFIIQGKDQQDSKNMLKQYMQFCDYPGESSDQEYYTFSDPYHGTVSLFRQNRYIVGVLNLADETLRMAYLRRVEQRMQEK